MEWIEGVKLTNEEVRRRRRGTWGGGGACDGEEVWEGPQARSMGTVASFI